MNIINKAWNAAAFVANGTWNCSTKVLGAVTQDSFKTAAIVLAGGIVARTLCNDSAWKIDKVFDKCKIYNNVPLFIKNNLVW